MLNIYLTQYMISYRNDKTCFFAKTSTVNVKGVNFQWVAKEQPQMSLDKIM